MVSRPLPSKSGTRCLRCAQETVRGELSSVGDNLAASVAPAVQAALAASLPKELSSAVKAGLDKQLAPAVAASLSGKPLQEAFRSAFAKQLVPAFEAATQAMFQQIQSAFAAGFEEHLQVGGAAASAGSMAHTEWLRLSSRWVLTCPSGAPDVARCSSPAHRGLHTNNTMCIPRRPHAALWRSLRSWLPSWRPPSAAPSR